MIQDKEFVSPCPSWTTGSQCLVCSNIICRCTCLCISISIQNPTICTREVLTQALEYCVSIFLQNPTICALEVLTQSLEHAQWNVWNTESHHWNRLEQQALPTTFFSSLLWEKWLECFCSMSVSFKIIKKGTLYGVLSKEHYELLSYELFWTIVL